MTLPASLSLCILSTAVAALLGSGCQEEPAPEAPRTVIVLHPRDFDPEATMLRVWTSLDDKRVVTPNDYTGGFDELDLELPATSVGRLRLDVRAVKGAEELVEAPVGVFTPAVLSRGVAELDLPGPGRYEVSIPLKKVVVTLQGFIMRTGGPSNFFYTRPDSDVCPGGRHLWVIEGTDITGPIIPTVWGGSQKESIWNLPLTAGHHSLVFLGTEHGEPLYQGTIYFFPSDISRTLDFAAPGGAFYSFPSPGPVVLVRSFSGYWPAPDRVSACTPTVDGAYDTVGLLTLEVWEHPQ